MLALLLVFLSVLDSPMIEDARSAHSLELGFRVIEAFERGPVIVEVSITNRGDSPVSATDPGNLDGLILAFLPQAWKATPRIPCNSGVGPHRVKVEPGESLQRQFVLQRDYVSDFPAGTYQIGVTWPLRWNLQRVVNLPTKTFPITITPASWWNRWALLTRLEAEFVSLPPSRRRRMSPQALELRDKLAYSQHKELIPLILKLLDRYPPQTDELIGNTICLDLVRTVFLCDPTAAHTAFVDRLLQTPPRVDPFDVFLRWEPPHLAQYLKSYFAEFAHTKHWDAFPWWISLTPWRPACEYLLAVHSHAPWRLSDTELQRLSAAKHPVVRELIEKTFGDRLKP